MHYRPAFSLWRPTLARAGILNFGGGVRWLVRPIPSAQREPSGTIGARIGP